MGAVKGYVEAKKVGIAVKAFVALGTIHIVDFHSFISRS